MLAFAANSLLCRLALQQPLQIDPASFGSLRLVSGALMLALIVRIRSRAGTRATPPAAPADWLAAAMLWAYVACFSFAYLTLSAGTGALILFGAVQLTMFAAGLRAGERFMAVAWGGLLLALAGFVYLVAPGLAAPSPVGAVLMAVAGIAWGVYSLRGRRSTAAPLAATASNFLRAAPLALALSLIYAAHFQASAGGVALAIASGALSSGLGYVIWYAALRGLTAMRAATVQLSVPPIAALGGALLLAETITPRLLLASVAILGGVALVLLSRSRAAATPRRA
ncbi:MAG: Permease of the drug/metabolite transporter (DMT) superfamily [Burkholderiaceae bacterium]|nr:MAG: Permease of the drug/metabolite transporter (DMT) superfamily [Burkholderiaceae bacterium]